LKRYANGTKRGVIMSEIITKRPSQKELYRGEFPHLEGIAKPTTKGRLWAYVKFILNS